MNDVVCINCGSKNPSIYKCFSNEVIKLTDCGECGKLVDKYVETEYSIIIIDMLLLRREALTHVLFNSNLKVAWKLIVLFILCDAYEKILSSQQQVVLMEHPTYINKLELNFYLMCIKSFLEYFIFAALVAIVLYYSQRNLKKFSAQHLFHSIVLASYGKLFMFPVLVWSKNDGYCETLITLFIYLSQIQALRVTTHLSSITIAVTLIAISKIGSLLVHNIL